jgi:hypothetical protein
VDFSFGRAALQRERAARLGVGRFPIRHEDGLPLPRVLGPCPRGQAERFSAAPRGIAGVYVSGMRAGVVLAAITRTRRGVPQADPGRKCPPPAEEVCRNASGRRDEPAGAPAAALASTQGPRGPRLAR